MILSVILLLLAAWTVRGLATAAYTTAAVTALVAVLLAGQTLLYLRTTRAGKFEVWVRTLSGLGLRGDERAPRPRWRMWWGGPWFPTHLVTAVKSVDTQAG